MSSSTPSRFIAIAALLLFSMASAKVLAKPALVFVSVLPVKTFVEQVGGEHVDVRAMVEPGSSPATYSPTPQQIAALADAQLYFRVGVPFEGAWMKRIQSANAGMAVVDLREGLKLRELEGHDHHDEDGHDGHGHKDHGHKDEGHKDEHAEHELDPHIWTSPEMVRQMLGRIRDRLIELDPANRASFEQNHDAYAARLSKLDADLHEQLHELGSRRFLVFHPSWGYFADRYHLQQVPIENQGKRPGARALAKLIEHALEDRIKVIFVQPQFDRRQADKVAHALGGGTVVVDPLAADYEQNLRRVAKQFVEALR